MATSIPRDCIIMTTWTFSAEPLTTLWLHLFSCSAALSLGLIIIRIILFLPSFLCPYCKFIPKLCQKYRSPFKTSEHNHHQFHFFFPWRHPSRVQSPCWTCYFLRMLPHYCQYYHMDMFGGGPCSTYRSEICSAFRDTGNSTSPALVPPASLCQPTTSWMCSCKNAASQPCLLVHKLLHLSFQESEISVPILQTEEPKVRAY